MQNLYDLLDIDPSASPAAVKKAYFKLAKKVHPDAGKTSDDAKFKLVTEAYKILSNPLERKEYDKRMEKQEAANEAGSARTADDLTRDFVRAARRQGMPEETADPRTLRRQERELKRERRRLMLWAVLRVGSFTAVTALMGGGYSVLFKFLLERATNQVFSPAYYFGGLLSGLVLGLIWSLDRNFEIESFISSPKFRNMYRHFRVFFFTLAVGFFATLLLGWILAAAGVRSVPVSVIALSFVLLLAATVSADGHFFERLTEGKWFSLFLLVMHNLMKGLIGAGLGGLIAVGLYLIFRRPEIIWEFAFCGYALTILFGSRAPEHIDRLNDVTAKPMKSVLYLFALVVMLGLGIGIGIIF